VGGVWVFVAVCGCLWFSVDFGGCWWLIVL
jgi:hypothetical protein